MLGIRELPVGHPDEVIEAIDQKILLTHVMQQALDDYIKLVHPSYRVKKYLQEHYLFACDFLFDPTYRLSDIKDDYGEDISVIELINIILDTEGNHIKQLQDHAITTAKQYWKEKPDVSAIDHIPDTVFIEGQTFNIEHAAIRKYTVDFDERVLTLNKEDSQVNHENFLEAVLFITADLNNSGLRSHELKQLSSALFLVLKANACFSQLGVAKMDELFQDIRQEL